MDSIDILLKDFANELNCEHLLFCNIETKKYKAIDLKNEAIVTEMSVFLLDILDKYTQDMQFEKTEQIQIKTKAGYLFFYKVKEKHSLLIFTKKVQNLALFNLSAERLVNSLTESKLV